MFDLKNISAAENPRKILKLILVLAAVFMFLWIFVLAQTDRNELDQSANIETVSNDSLPLSLKMTPKKASTGNDHSIFMNVVPVILLLGGAIVGLWFWQKKDRQKESDLFTVIGKQQIGVGQQIVVMYLNEEYWVLALSGKDVSLLERFSKDEWKGPHKDEQVKPTRFLNIFMEKKQKYAS